MSEHHPDAERPGSRRRTWWPALVGAGVAVAAVAGIVLIVGSDADDEQSGGPTESGPGSSASDTVVTTEPESTSPATSATTVPVAASPSVALVDGCIVVTSSEGSATGCPQQLSEPDTVVERTFVADLAGPVVVTSAPPFDDPRSSDDSDQFAARCRWDDLERRIPAGGMIEVVACTDTGVMGATTGRSPQDDADSYFTLPTRFLPEGGELGPGAPVDGLPGALAFTIRVDDVVTCSLLLRPDRSGWNEACGLADDTESRPAVVRLGSTAPTVHEITIDAAGLITSARPLDAMAPSSGCTIDSAVDLLGEIEAASIVTNIGCIGDKAAMVSGSVLTQEGPPDGSIWLALRSADGTWGSADSGTGIESELTFPVVAFAVWETWPRSTEPGFRSFWWEPIITMPSRPDVTSFADDLLATMTALADDPEFPAEARLVAIEPNGTPLIVAQVEFGGDDSVSGAVVHVWLQQEFDLDGPVGWRAQAVLVGDVCARGDSTGQVCI